MSFDFKNKVAVITGGATGIGVATVETLCELGARVAVLDRNREKGKGLAEELSGKGDAVSFHFCEMADEPSVQAATKLRRGNMAAFTCWCTAPESSATEMFWTPASKYGGRPWACISMAVSTRCAARCPTCWPPAGAPS